MRQRFARDWRDVHLICRRKVKGTLEFEKAGKIDVEYAVEALGATAPTASEHHH